MDTSVFVISDLHLGGADGFQMCSAQGQARLAQFFAWVASQGGKGRRIELVIAGDIVDFLAEEDQTGGTWSAFTPDETAALRKLERILRAAQPVWDGLAACVASKCVVTLMLGNHDIELSLPRVRHRLLEQLGPGAVEFLYDNQAYTRGGLLIEHGNRYEGWNVVDHDALRRVRSQLSRGEVPDDFPVQPGSNLVVKVMNKLKQEYAWVDLLKPETSGVVPMLAALNAGLWRKAAPAILAGLGAAWREKQFGRDGMPTKDSYVSGEASQIDEWVRTNIGDETTQIAGESSFETEAAFAALRAWGEKDGRSFWVEREDKRYLEAAGTLAQRGFEVVIFGHTHHVKRVALPNPSYATYLNTGTWADLIAVPPEVFDGDEMVARAKFGTFFTALKNNDIATIRRLLPTFARIDFDAKDAIVAKNVYFFDGPDNTPAVTTDAILHRVG